MLAFELNIIGKLDSGYTNPWAGGSVIKCTPRIWKMMTKGQRRKITSCQHKVI